MSDRRSQLHEQFQNAIDQGDALVANDIRAMRARSKKAIFICNRSVVESSQKQNPCAHGASDARAGLKIEKSDLMGGFFLRLLNDKLQFG